MPSKSRAQQRLFGMVRSAQKGEKAASPKVAKLAKRMKKKSVRDFAKTKHKGKPERVRKKTRKEDIESELVAILENILSPDQIDILLEGSARDYEDLFGTYGSIDPKPAFQDQPETVEMDFGELARGENITKPLGVKTSSARKDVGDIINIIMTSLEPDEIDRVVRLLTTLRKHPDVWRGTKVNEDITKIANLITEDIDIYSEDATGSGGVAAGGEAITDDMPMTEAGKDGNHKCRICGESCGEDGACDTKGCPNNRGDAKEISESRMISYLLEALAPQQLEKMAAGRERAYQQRKAGRHASDISTLAAIARKEMGKELSPEQERLINIMKGRSQYSRKAKAAREKIQAATGKTAEQYLVDLIKKKAAEKKGREPEYGWRPGQKQEEPAREPAVESLANDDIIALCEEIIPTPMESKTMKGLKLIKESAKGRLSRRTHRMLDVASGGRILTEDEWKNRVGEDNFGLAKSMGLFQMVEGEILNEQPPMVGGDEGPPEFDEGGEEEISQFGDEEAEVAEVEEETEEEIEEEMPITKDELAKFLEAIIDRADDEALAMINKAIASEEEMEGEFEEAEEAEETAEDLEAAAGEEEEGEDIEESCEGCKGTLVIEDGMIYVEKEDQIVDEIYVIAEAEKKNGWPKELKKGRFTSYCKSAGFDGPSVECAKKAMKSKDSSVRGMASFYMNTVKPGGKTASAAKSKD